MFNKKKKVNPSSTDTLIGEKSKIEGSIKSEAGLRIEGGVFGSIECGGDVTIGKGGIVESQITARNVTTAGKIFGSVQARGLLSILPSGQVHGDIRVKSLSIAEGGIFYGNSRMEKTQEPKSEAKLQSLDAAHEKSRKPNQHAVSQ